VTEPAEPSPPDRGVDWRPPRSRESNVASMVVGLILLAIGVWYLLDQTLGIRMPRIDWSDIWPIFLIGIGAIVLIRSSRRGS
jgi:predicted membrane channel-forming protein YqfA (hemolysin III family)